MPQNCGVTGTLPTVTTGCCRDQYMVLPSAGAVCPVASGAAVGSALGNTLPNPVTKSWMLSPKVAGWPHAVPGSKLGSLQLLGKESAAAMELGITFQAVPA